jgi:predicted metalloendopeptidase
MAVAATGRRYDKDGNLKQWWTEGTLREYEQRVQCIVEQYSQYNVSQLGDNFTVSHRIGCSLCGAAVCTEDIMCLMFQVNGINTQGENIADNGGLREALRAYHKFRERFPDELLLPGLTQYSPEQLFFLGFAHVSAGVHILFVIGVMMG